MSLYPTHDKNLQLNIELIINNGVFDQIGTTAIANNIIAYLEERGYHIGLPESIEWALGYKVSVDYYFCMSCQIRHKGKGCPKCGNDFVIGELENK